MSDYFNDSGEVINNNDINFKNIQNASNQNFTNSLNMGLVKSLSGWGMFRAVIDIISGGFSCLGGILFLFVSLIIFISGNSAGYSLDIYNSFEGMNPDALKALGIVFLICSVIYPIIGVLRIIYSVNLIKAIDNLKRAVALNNESLIAEFLNRLAKFFKFNGIVSILKISLYFLMFVFYIVIIIFLASTVSSGEFMNEFNNSSKFFQ